MIIRAHLRGLLKPYYTNGFRSIGAENLLFTVMSYEDAGKAKEMEVQVEKEILTMLRTEAVGGKIRKLHNTARYARRLCMLVNEDPEAEDAQSVAALVKLYHALEKQGIIYNEPDPEPEDV